jgi:hypothetical protein
LPNPEYPGTRLTTYLVEHVDGTMHHQTMSDNPTANFEKEEHLLFHASRSSMAKIQILASPFDIRLPNIASHQSVLA